MKTFREFILECYELEESSTGERSRGRATLGRGRGADMTSNERSIASIAKKARLRGTGKYSTKDLRTPSRLYTNNNPDGYGDKGSTKVSHYVTTHASPRSAATSPDLEVINKNKGPFWISIDNQKIPQFLHRDKFALVTDGWYYSNAKGSVEIKTTFPHKDSEIVISFAHFDLIGM